MAGITKRVRKRGNPGDKAWSSKAASKATQESEEPQLSDDENEPSIAPLGDESSADDSKGQGDGEVSEDDNANDSDADAEEAIEPSKDADGTNGKVDFSSLIGVGEHSDSSDEEGPLEAVAVSRLPSQYFGEHRNDEAALKKKLADIALFAKDGQQTLPFWESLSVTMPLEKKLPASLALDDLKRERRFAELATASAHLGLEKLRKQKTKFRRPTDYFAEMVKTDAHMGKIKSKILHQKERIESAEKRRNNREIAKNRKKVRSTQLQKEQEKKQKANEEIEAVSRLRKERLKQRADASEDAGEDEDDAFPIELLDVEQLDEENRFRPQAEIASGKRKAWKEKRETKGSTGAHGDGKRTRMARKGGKDRAKHPGRQDRNETSQPGKKYGVAGGVKKPKGSKKRLGRNRRKAAAAKKS